MGLLCRRYGTPVEVRGSVVVCVKCAEAAALEVTAQPTEAPFGNVAHVAEAPQPTQAPAPTRTGMALNAVAHFVAMRAACLEVTEAALRRFLEATTCCPTCGAMPKLRAGSDPTRFPVKVAACCPAGHVWEVTFNWDV